MRSSRFYLGGGTGQDGVASHTGTLQVEDCSFFISAGVEYFIGLFRVFDGSRDCRFVNNHVVVEKPLESTFALMTNYFPAQKGRQNEDFLVQGNMARLKFGKLHSRKVRRENPQVALAWVQDVVKNIEIRGNFVDVEFTEGFPIMGVKVEQAERLVLSDNSVRLRRVGGNGGGLADAVSITDTRGGTIRDNLFAGDFRNGLVIGEGSDELVIEGNYFGEK